MLGNKERGNMGEKIAADFLQSRGYVIKRFNAKNKIGEIDLVTRHPQGQLCFVEVKTVGCDISQRHFQYDPVDKLSRAKIHKLHRTIISLLGSAHADERWQLDAVVVYLDTDTNQARCEHFEHISREW